MGKTADYLSRLHAQQANLDEPALIVSAHRCAVLEHRRHG